MVCRDGRLIDGTFIHDAIDAIEKETSTRPLCYMANCIHPDILHQALLHPRNDTPLVRQRFQGIQANAANLSPEELNGCEHLISSPPEELADRLMTLLWDFPLKICAAAALTSNICVVLPKCWLAAVTRWGDNDPYRACNTPIIPSFYGSDTSATG